jgi:HEAT repeat protein
VKTLERWGDDRAVGPLVKLMEKEKDRKVRVYIATALKRLTKQRYEDDAGAWRAYYKTVTENERLEQVDKAFRRQAQR